MSTMKSGTLKLLAGGLALALAGGGYGAYAAVKAPKVATSTRTVTATLGDVSESISGTGAVQASATSGP